METFVLITWLWVRQRYEEVRIPGLVESECLAQMRKMWRHPAAYSRFMIPDKQVRDPTHCVDSRGRKLPTVDPSPICASAECIWLKRRRV